MTSLRVAWIPWCLDAPRIQSSLVITPGLKVLMVRCPLWRTAQQLLFFPALYLTRRRFTLKGQSVAFLLGPRGHVATSMRLWLGATMWNWVALIVGKECVSRQSPISLRLLLGGLLIDGWARWRNSEALTFWVGLWSYKAAGLQWNKLLIRWSVQLLAILVRPAPTCREL